MRILKSIGELSGAGGPVVLAAGVFDGMHLGHTAVLRTALDHAKAIDGVPVALTFDPHPLRTLRPEGAPRLLTSTPHKLRLLEATGFPCVLLVHFDAAFAATTAEDFVHQLVSAARPLARICVGEGWRFGRDRLGDNELLAAAGVKFGFSTTFVRPVRVGDLHVSSTAIRAAIASGDLDSAARMLGRRYAVLGTVQGGAGLGRQLGFPTANLAAHNEQFPPDGVYAVRVMIDGQIHGGIANIGTRPTVTASGERLLEVHVFEFSGDLYGRDIEAEFVARVRDERKFAGPAELAAQIQRDATAARECLGEAKGQN